MPRALLGTIILSILAILLGGCSSVSNSPGPQPTALPGPAPVGDLTKVNHVVYMLQENRSFDHYFGQLNAYRQSQGVTTSVDATPANAAQLGYDHGAVFTPFHMNSMCTEDMSGYWNESHNAWNHTDHTSATPALDGFPNAAGGDARANFGFDLNGRRVMGYYTDQDLPYYYFMATQFAMSDRWFSPVMTNTPANRLYAMA